MLKDVIYRYQQTQRILESSPNSKIQLTAIISFFKYCEDNDCFHLYKTFLPDFLNHLINIFKNSSIDFIDPQYFIAAKFLLNQSSIVESDDIIINEINSAIYLINIRLLILYYYIGEAENGLIILKDLLNSKSVSESGVSLNYNEKSSMDPISKSSSLVDPEIFKVNKAYDILRQINYEINRINSYSKNEVNILLVESDNEENDLNSFSIVQSLQCSIKNNDRISLSNPFIENIIDIQEEGLGQIRKALVKSTNIILTKFRVNLNIVKNQINLKFREIAGIYKGTSFGAGAAILIPSVYLSAINSRTQYSISCSAAFTGSIDENGNLISIPDKSIETKIEAAFFSWVKYVVVPAGNLLTANEKLYKLNRMYPEKKLNVIGVKNITEILENELIIRREKDSVYLHSKKYVRRHQALAYTFTSLIIIIATILLINKLFPKNPKPLPEGQNSRSSKIFYAPDRDTVWIFNNLDKQSKDTIFFGDVAIGDQWLHQIELWNIDNKKNSIEIDLTGKDKDEFDFMWNMSMYQPEAPENILPDILQPVSIKFAPIKSGGNKEAQLVIYSKDKPDDKKILYLIGTAGKYINGYSIKQQYDDDLIIDLKKGNVLKYEFTVSFWFKTNKAGIALLNCGTIDFSKTKFSFNVSIDTVLLLSLIRPQKDASDAYILKSKSKIKLNGWNYTAITVNRSDVKIYLNDEINSFKISNNDLNEVQEFFTVGETTHPALRNVAKIRNDDWYINFAELRLYNKPLSEQEIFSKRFTKENPDDERLIVYYDFNEAYANDIFDRTKSEIFMNLYGKPGRSLDMPPLISENGKKQSASGNDEYVLFRNKGVANLNKNIFKNRSDFTIQYDAKAGGDLNKKSRVFYNIWSSNVTGMGMTYTWNYIYGDSIIIACANLYNTPFYKKLAAVIKRLDTLWHRYTIDYSIERNKGRFFIDGILQAEYDFGNYEYDISRQLYFILFGNGGAYFTNRYIGEETSIDNIEIFNRTLEVNEILQRNETEVKKIPGVIVYWTFSKYDSNIIYDEINNMPLFLWEEYQLLNKY